MAPLAGEIYTHIIPLSGGILSILFLHTQPHLYHLLSTLLILTGIAICSLAKKQHRIKNNNATFQSILTEEFNMLRIYLYLILAASSFRAGDRYDRAGATSVTKAFHSDYSSIQLTISGFLVIYACSQLLSGFIGEKLGKLRVLTASFFAFPGGSLLFYGR